MTEVSGLTDDPIQQFGLVLTDGTKAQFTFTFRPQQEAWYMDLAYTFASGSAFTMSGLKLRTHPNVLRQWENTLPFGLMVTGAGLLDPDGLEDWVNGNCALYLLQGADIAQVESTVFPG